ncbi:MAG: class I SAM-dependent methyltransferase [Vicinamibacterales bacterium]
MSFDRLAPHYDWMEALTAGNLLQTARTIWLGDLRGCRRVLSAGEGHGRFATAFGRRFPDARLTCVDASPAMLARARRRAEAAQVSAEWIHGTVPAWRPPRGGFDAVVTCFFLDCFDGDELRTVVAALAEGAASGATWLVVDFAVPARGPKRWRAQAMHVSMYAFFRATTRISARRVTPPDDLLRAEGFRLKKRRELSWGLLRADLWVR